MRVRAIGAAAGLALALAPGVARADHCSLNIVVFSGNRLPEDSPAQPVYINSGALTCDQLQHDYDGNIINPGATHFYLRYTIDLGESTPTLTARVTGMGFADDEVTLVRQPFQILGVPLSGIIYDSPTMPFADLAAAAQFLFVSIEVVEGEAPETMCFHTLIGACP